MEQVEKFLSGKNILITGGSSGIGASCAIEMARRGANIGMNYHSDKEGAEKIKKSCEEFDVKTAIYKGDVGSEEDVKSIFLNFEQDIGPIDILVANAGIQKDKAFKDMSLEDWNAVISTNLTGQFLTAQAATKSFTKNKSKGPSIIFMSSVHDIIPWSGHVNYATSKGGVSMLMKSMALELAPQKIRVNAVSPGAIKTDINEEAWQDEDAANKLKKLIPLNRIGEGQDIAHCVAWLASDYASYITGTTIYVDGGMTLYPGFTNNG